MLATATILICLYIWNDVFYALFVVGGRLDTLPLNLYQVASSGLYLQNWHLIFAYIILMSLPLLHHVRRRCSARSSPASRAARSSEPRISVQGASIC